MEFQGEFWSFNERHVMVDGILHFLPSRHFAISFMKPEQHFASFSPRDEAKLILSIEDDIHKVGKK